MNDDKKISKAHVLVIDDDTRIRDLVSRYLSEHGFLVLTAQSANEAREIMTMFSFDVLVVDVMMPGDSGLVFTKGLRAENIDVPVLLLTALGEVDDRISGLEAGADDYLPKPFDPKELVLRLNAILRRSKNVEKEDVSYTIGLWHFDPDFDELKHTQGEEDIRLTSVEANLLRALAESAGQTVTRDDLADRCGLDAGERTIDVQVTRLRRKLEENTKMPKYLQTVRGKGYLLRADRI